MTPPRAAALSRVHALASSSRCSFAGGAPGGARLRLALLPSRPRYGCKVSAKICTDDPHSVLGLAPDATKDQIKRQYRRLALRLHPDVSESPDPEVIEEFEKVTAAYNVLMGRRPAMGAEMDAGDAEWGEFDWYWAYKRNREGRRVTHEEQRSGWSSQLSGMSAHAERKRRQREQRQRELDAAAAAAEALRRGKEAAPAEAGEGEGDGDGAQGGLPSGGAGRAGRSSTGEAHERLSAQLQGLKRKAVISRAAAEAASRDEQPSPAHMLGPGREGRETDGGQRQEEEEEARLRQEEEEEEARLLRLAVVAKEWRKKNGMASFDEALSSTDAWDGLR